MLQRLIVYGLLAICATWVFTAEASRFWRDKLRTQREEIEIVVVQPQITQIRNLYQTEYEKLLYPTVRITTGFSIGSGVIINRKDAKVAENMIYILTAAHVVGNESKVTIEFFSHQDTKTPSSEFTLSEANVCLSAFVAITDTAKDLALLTIHNSSFITHNYTASLTPKDYTPYIFTPVYSVGCSLGLPPRPSEGIITAINDDSWEVSSPILPGNSGGPVFDRRTYKVIGIAVWVKVYQGQLVTTMAGIVPVNQIYKFLEQTSDGFSATGGARK